MDIKKALKELKKPFNEIKEEFEEKAPFPMPKEVSLRHPDKPIGIHLRDDGALELFAGESKIILDGETGSIIIDGTNITNNIKKINNLIQERNGFLIENSPLNSSWYDFGQLNDSSDIIEESEYITRKSPIIAKDKKSLEFEVLAGVPAEGQYLVPLNEYFESKLLFLPPEEVNILEELKKLASEI